MTRAKAAYWTIPSLLCVVVYWAGFRAWFQQDDFAWLRMASSLKGPGDLLPALFVPMAQGTIRPLSERGFFLLFHALFGFNAAPYRVCVFLTQFASLVLLSAVARRVSGSRAVGFLAPVLWVLNISLVVSLSWTSAYNQILCGFFLLLAFFCRLRRMETDGRRWAWGEWAAFLGGLASLEIAIVYPALVAAYLLLRRTGERFGPKSVRSALGLFGISVVYGILHYFAAPYESGDPAYVLHLGWSMVQTAWIYWRTALGPRTVPPHFGHFPMWISPIGTVALMAGIAAFVVWSVRRRQWVGLFGLAWFLVTLAPVLPLRDHVSSYYLTIPSIGLALAGATALETAWRSGRVWRVAAVGLAAVYAASGLATGALGSRSVAERSFRIRTAVLGVRQARKMMPGKTIVLAGVDSGLFWTGLSADPFRVMGMADVFLEPGTEERIPPRLGQPPVSDFVIPTGTLKKALEEGRAVVYVVEHRRLRGATTAYLIKARDEWKVEEPWRVEVGDQAFAAQLGPTWWKLENGHRWMPRVASLRIHGPKSADESLWIAGWCPPEQAKKGPVRIHVAAGGKSLPRAAVVKASGEFRFGLKLPEELIGLPAIDVVIEVDRVFRAPGDQRDLGLVFGTFEVGR